MYSYIKGKVVNNGQNFVIVDNNNIGYHIIVSNPYFYEINKEYKFFVHFHIKENLQILYGFNDNKNLLFFKKLLDVPTIGPKSALMLSETDNLEQVFQAIENNDNVYLRKFPGIGIKSAQQIILKLKGDLIFSEKIILNPKKTELEKILLNLGFVKKEIKSVLNQIDDKKELELMLKEVLLKLAKNI
ncbi:Holliday junction resolvasome, DNA-binding subunit [Candidatus Phytoplasma mali]|uniref:Holliday junction branch migration complex subunit RuvA n=1 Tax=Phytoplasma mali (strain AT) TaxID=482235 RepID=RUVA_PHYMT|nr:Holliday junction branch migration protein RuvA [Candidatus Phytoplasma mali]B3R0J1.1 RecName: Full=Holliday junction branch migration complex subunit RuvA [Candidatus Phytoplasma mali AT]CAP18355.1 Holliday junction resolvasome, DNA-binding subunit [Candidatus Phytoplasma mali]